MFRGKRAARNVSRGEIRRRRTEVPTSQCIFRPDVDENEAKRRLIYDEFFITKVDVIGKTCSRPSCASELASRWWWTVSFSGLFAECDC